MHFILLAWLFALAVTLHNLEEAIWLPRWSKTAGRWHHSVGAREFRFAVLMLTLLAYAAVYATMAYGKESWGAYLLSGYALAMLLNVFFPHVLATIVLRRYAPGTFTAVSLNLPVTLLLSYQGIQEGYVQVSQLLWVGPLIVLGILATIPILFALGRRLPGFKKQRD